MTNFRLIVKKLIIALSLLAAIATGCRSTKDNTLTTTSGPQVTSAAQQALDQRLSAFVATQGSWTTLQAGGNIKVTGSQTLSSGMQLRMIRDKAIYISVRPMLGIEVAKLVVTSDSVLVVDKYHKRYVAEPLSLITNGIPVTIGTLQDIFLGRAFVLGSGSLNNATKGLVQLTADGDRFRLEPKQQPQGFNYEFAINDKNQLQSVTVTPTRGSSTPYTAHYSHVFTTLAGLIAHHADVKAQVGGSSLGLSLDLKDITWGAPFTIDSAKPGEGYKRLSASQITSLLGGN